MMPPSALLVNSAKPLGSSNRSDVVGIEHRIGRQDRQVLELRLRDEETIERVAMMLRERGDMQRVSLVDGQRQDAKLLEPRGHVYQGRIRQTKPAL